MSRKSLWYLYLVVIHLIFAGTSVYLLREQPAWIILVEVVLVLSLIVGVRLVRAIYRPLEILRAATDLMQSRDFASRFRESGNPEMDGLVRVYNRMADELHAERIRNEEQEHFLRKILETGATAVVTFDFGGEIAQINPAAAALFEMTPAEAIGRHLPELGSPFAALVEEVAGGETTVLPLHGRRRVRCHRGSFLDRGFARAFVVMDELTDELRRSERSAYEKLIRVISHEVNNTTGGVTSLLTSCLNYADQLDSEDRDDFRNAIEVARSRSDRLNEFVRGFADVVRLPPPAREPVRLDEMLTSLQQFFASECRDRHIKWIAPSPTAPVPPVDVDPTQMERALVNVFRNAIDAIGEDGEIHVTLHRNGSRTRVEVVDTGGGIPEPVRAHLFEPFYSSKSQGRGIGLTLVQEILVGHGIEFALDDVGTGARFTMTV